MELNDLLASDNYNIVDDIEKYNSDKTALILEKDNGDVTKSAIVHCSIKRINLQTLWLKKA